MKGRILTTAAIMLVLLALPSIQAAEEPLNITAYTIEIDGVAVSESLTVVNVGSENVTSLTLWVQQGITELQVSLDGEELVATVDGNLRHVDLSIYNISLLPDHQKTIRLSYVIPAGSEFFQKRMQYDGASVNVKYNDNDIFNGEGLSTEQFISLRLTAPVQAPLDMMYIIVMGVMVGVIIILLVLLARKSSPKKRENLKVDSKEVLETRKELLVSLLKDLEKKHRSESIADDTYNKVKSEYKQQAVETMKYLEDMQKKD